jgi:hypothetical protein
MMRRRHQAPPRRGRPRSAASGLVCQI